MKTFNDRTASFGPTFWRGARLSNLHTLKIEKKNFNQNFWCVEPEALKMVFPE